MFRLPGFSMAVLLGAALAGAPMVAPTVQKPGLVSQAPTLRYTKKWKAGGFLPAGGKRYRTHGLSLTAAQQKRASIKRRNRLRHKRHCQL